MTDLHRNHQAGGDERARWTLALASVATFVLMLDLSVVSVALPDVRRDLAASFAELQWVIDAYTLLLAAALLPAASLADLRGRRLIFLVGAGLFTLASAASAVAASGLVLNVGRAAQGLGGALIMATVLPLISAAFPAHRRPGALAVYGAAAGAGLAVGPLVGGALTDLFGWRAIFIVNVPIGVLVVLAGRARLAESRDPSGRRIDVAGLLLLSGGLLALVFALLRGESEGWGSVAIVAAFAAATVLLVAFIVLQAAGRERMLDLRLFAQPAFSAATLAVLSLSVLFGVLVYLIVWLQGGVGYSPLEAGAIMLPATVTAFLVGALSGRLLGRLAPSALVVAALGIFAAGTALLIGIDAEDEWIAAVPALVLMGVGLGLQGPASAEAALRAVAPAQAGIATGVVNVARQLGFALGIAVLGVLFHAAVADALAEQLPGAASGQAGELADAVAGGAGAEALGAAATRAALAAGLSDIALAATGLGVISLLAVVALSLAQRRRTTQRHASAQLHARSAC